METKEKRIPKAMELTARFESNLAFIIIAPAKVIVGIEDSKIAAITRGVKAISSKLKITTKIKGASKVLDKTTIIVPL